MLITEAKAPYCETARGDDTIHSTVSVGEGTAAYVGDIRRCSQYAARGRAATSDLHRRARAMA